MSQIEVMQAPQNQEAIDVRLGAAEDLGATALSDYHGEGGTRDHQPQGPEGVYPRTEADAEAEQKSEAAWDSLEADKKT